MKKLLLVLSVLVCGVAIAETALEYRSGGFYAGQFSRITCADCSLVGNELTFPAGSAGEALSPVRVTTPFVDAGQVLSPYVRANTVDAGTVNVSGALSAVFVDAGNVTAGTFRSQSGTDYGTIRQSGDGLYFSSQGTSVLILNGATGLAGFNYSIDVTSNATIHGAILVGTTANFYPAAPTIGAGFCTSPSVTAGNSVGFDVLIGSSCTGVKTGTLTFAAASNGWVCTCHNITNPATNVVEQTGGSTTTCTMQNYARTTGLAADVTAADHLRCTAVAF